jgi:hypothetical protein
MSSQLQPDVLARLRAANPAAVEPDRGRSELAQATLQRILEDQSATARDPSKTRGRWRNPGRSPRGLAIVFATLLIGGGAAFAATDPLGWWSANPGEAKYGANPAVHVRTPTIQEITCRSQSAGQFRCTAARSGQRYYRVDAIEPPGTLTRAKFTAAMSQDLAAGKMSSAQAAKFKADLAAVPDSFFRKFDLASRFGTYGAVGEMGNGRTLAPPPGVPGYLVCENAGSALSCQNLNGDTAAPVGAGVYAAEPTAAWRPAPPKQQNFSLPPGITFTPAEYRVIIDMIQHMSAGSSSGGTISSSSGGTTSSSSGGTIPPQAIQTSRKRSRH